MHETKRHAGPKTMIRTVVAERVGLIRAGLVACITEEQDMEVVAQLDRGDAVLAAVSSLRPDVAVIDEEIAQPEGFGLVRALHTTRPACPILIMAERPHPRSLRRAVAAQATGYLSKSTAPEDIRAAIRQVAKGMKAIDAALAFATLDAPHNPMSPRECDVLRLAAEGIPTAEIARRLCLTAGTVRNHISSIIAKTGARNRVDAIRIANHRGWL
jgi:two-component system, NarL family, response regulator DesR